MLVSRIVIVFPTAGDSRLGHLSRERKGNVLIARPASEPESRSLEMSVMVNVIKRHGSQAPVSRTLNQVHCHHILSEKAWTDICGTTWFNTLYTRIVETMCEFQPSSYGSHVWLWASRWAPLGLTCFFLETWPGATFAREWTNYITSLTTGTIDKYPRKSSSHHPSWKSGIFAEILRHLTLD